MVVNIIPNSNKYIHLKLKILKKVTTYVERAASNHLISYAKILCKSKRVQEKNLAALREEVLYVIFLDLHKAYDVFTETH